MEPYNQLVELVRAGIARKATKYISPSCVVKVTARQKRDKRSRTLEMVLTIGKPNYAERKLIRSAIKAKEKFPIRKILIQPWKT